MVTLLQNLNNGAVCLPVYFQLTSSRWRCGSVGMCFFIQDQQWTCWSVGEIMKKLERRQKCEFFFMVSCVSVAYLSGCHKPVLAEADHAAVILVASPLIQHAGVDDMSNRDIEVVGTQMLQQVQGLVLRWLGHQDRPKSFTYMTLAPWMHYSSTGLQHSKKQNAQL